MVDSLVDKVAIVTGAGRGIGRGIARMMAQEGAKLVVADPGVNVDGSGADSSVAAAVAEEIRAAGGQAVPAMDSVTSMDGGERIVQTAVDNFGKLDIVVTCAGILRDRMLFNMTEQEWDDVIAVHLKGTFTVVKHACILFRQQRSGRIITFTSESGLVGNSGQANYGAAKSGIAGFTKVVAKDMGRYGITANAIAPRANTRMIGDIPDSAAEIRERSGVAPISGGDTLTQLDPDRIAPFVCYLASDYAYNVNGQTFLVYGDTISLMSLPRPERSIYEPSGHWDMATLSAQAREMLTAGIDNPAPAQQR